jgi:hypothetical protein
MRYRRNIEIPIESSRWIEYESDSPSLRLPDPEILGQRLLEGYKITLIGRPVNHEQVLATIELRPEYFKGVLSSELKQLPDSDQKQMMRLPHFDLRVMMRINLWSFIDSILKMLAEGQEITLSRNETRRVYDYLVQSGKMVSWLEKAEFDSRNYQPFLIKSVKSHMPLVSPLILIQTLAALQERLLDQYDQQFEIFGSLLQKFVDQYFEGTTELGPPELKI